MLRLRDPNPISREVFFLSLSELDRSGTNRETLEISREDEAGRGGGGDGEVRTREVVARRGGENRDRDVASGEGRAQGELHAAWGRGKE